MPASNLYGSSFQLVLDCDLADHLAAEIEGRHPLEQLGAAPEHADAGRAAELVRGEGEVELALRVEHLTRLLRGHGGVEVGERLAVEALLEDWEVRA